MPKGFFSQCFCLLTDGSPTISTVKRAIEAAGFQISNELPAADHWEFTGPALLVPYRPEVNGTISIDVVNHPWPDTMGDPKSAPTTFGAWSMGFFGPFAYPGGFARAVQHRWDAGRSIAPTHQGMIRLRISYAGGTPTSTPVLPKDYEPLAELNFLNRLTIAAGETSGVLCYFNPGGELLRDLIMFDLDWQASAVEQKLPLLLWSSIRLFKLDPAFSFMDSVGNGQFDVSDIEVIYPTNGYDPSTIDYYIRNVTHHLLGLNRPLQTGETIDGPGESNLSWLIESLDTALTAPPRPVLRLYPAADAPAIRALLNQQ